MEEKKITMESFRVPRPDKVARNARIVAYFQQECIDGDKTQMVAVMEIAQAEGIAIGTVRKALEDSGILNEWRMVKCRRQMDKIESRL